MKSWTKPTIEIVEEVILSVKTENDRQYFFSKLENPNWLEPLRVKGYFSNPPGIRKISDNEIQFPYWPELNYLIKVSEVSPIKVCDIVLELPKSDNPRIYEGIIEIALRVGLENSKRIFPKIEESLKISQKIIVSNYSELIKFWNDTETVSENLTLISELIKFNADINDKEKRSHRTDKKDGYFNTLKPTTSIPNYEYRRILLDGVRPLSKLAPLSTSKVLIKLTLDMIYLKTYKLNNGDWPEQDYSELWCRRLDKPSSGNNSVEEDLVQTLTYACEQVYSNDKNAIEELNNLLKKYHWSLFKRIRQHLYAKFPNKQNLPWIREFILNHKDYNRWEHHYEFQLMIKNAIFHFGFDLLNQREQKQIFDKILEGPPRSDYQKSKDDDISDEKYIERQKYFHFMQLLPFKPILIGQYKDYFKDISQDKQDKINDENYQQFGNVKSGFITQKSPISKKHIRKLSDEELLKLLNDWDDEHHDKDDWLNEVSIEGLAEMFQTLIKDKIISNTKRMNFWIKNDDIKRPIYVTSIIYAMSDLVVDGQSNEVKLWLEFCHWVIQKNTIRKTDKPNPSDQSAKSPDWDTSKRAVIDLIIKLLKKKDNLPIALRSDISGLLTKSWEMHDYRLDQHKKVFLSENDPFSEAINNTRSKALETWILFGIWVRKFDSNDRVFELTQVLDKRLSDNEAIPLTSPEYAMIGFQFNNLYSFNEEWAIQNKSLLFPQNNKTNWQAAFTSYIRYRRPFKVIFEILKDDFEFAFNNFHLLEKINGFGTDVIRQFGNHIFTYYLWNEFELEDQSLIYKYYSITEEDIDSRVNLFSHAGYILKDNIELKENLIDRIKKFFSWRLSENCSKELSHFYDWLEASCIESSWLLESYSKTLDILDKGDENLSYAIEPLYKHLNDSEELVIECFRKLTGLLEKESYVYIPVDKAKQILKIGLNHSDKEVQQNAEEARENLLKVGRFDFMEV